MLQNKRQTVLIVLALLLLPAVIVFGQQSDPGAPAPGQGQDISVSDQEVEKFVAAFMEIQSIQQNVQMEIGTIIQDSSFSQERFLEIYQAQQQSAQGNSDPEQSPDLSSQEEEAYEQTLSQINQVQQGMQSRMETAIQEEELAVGRFNQIYGALSQSPEIQERVRSELQEQQSQSGGAQSGQGSSGS